MLSNSTSQSRGTLHNHILCFFSFSTSYLFIYFSFIFLHVFSSLLTICAEYQPAKPNLQPPAHMPTHLCMLFLFLLLFSFIFSSTFCVYPKQCSPPITNPLRSNKKGQRHLLVRKKKQKRGSLCCNHPLMRCNAHSARRHERRLQHREFLSGGLYQRAGSAAAAAAAAAARGVREYRYQRQHEQCV